MYTEDKSFIKKVDNLKKDLRKSTNPEKWKFGVLLREGDMVIKPEALYSQCVVSLFYNSNISVQEYCKILEYGKKVYREMFPIDDKTPNFDILATVFLEMFHEDGVITRGCFNHAIYNLFSNKLNFVKWMQGVVGDARFSYDVKFIADYGIEARGYFPSEDMFTANFILVSKKIIESNDPATVYKAEAKKIEHMAGIYEVDEAMLMEAEQQIESAKATIDRSRDVLAMVDERIKSINSLSEHAVERVKQITTTEVELAQGQMNSIETRMRDAYDKFLDTQRERILFDKKELVDQVVTESEVKLEEFRQNVRSIVNMAKLELSKINQESGTVMAKLESFMKDDEKLKGLLRTSADQEKIMKKIEKLMILNDNNIGYLETKLAEEAAMQKQLEENAKEAEKAAGASQWAGSSKNGNAQKGAANGTVAPVNVTYKMPAQTGQNIVVSEEDETIPDVNPLLDENIPFKERFDMVMKMKKKLEASGEHFHKMFDDVLIAVMENVNPYLIGPSGCGKTFMVGQICKLLGADYIDIGYINEEYDILGFQTANGGYSKPNFYRCYKYGKIAFCDELDNGNSRATVKLNSFLSNTKGAGYNFPHGEHVKRHENFRIIAAGNTSGNGADSVYNTREKIEESVQQRFTPIFVDYDNAVEKEILGGCDDWFEFVVLFRQATDAWSKKSHSVAPGIITTRDTARIKKYIENGSFNMEKILDYEFIQTKDESYLAFLAEFISSNIAKDSPAKNISDAFIKKVEKIRMGQ